MTLIDTHAHYNHKQFNSDRDNLLASLSKHGVEAVINVGYDVASSQASIELAEMFSHVYAAVGVHPHDAETLDDTAIEALRLMARHPKVKAIGECGLDYFRNLAPREAQQTAFHRQLILAREVGLPAIIHARDACADSLSMTNDFPDVPMVFHCYSGSADMAAALRQRGRVVSFTPNITYPKVEHLRQAAVVMGLDNIMLETDCPYMAPQSQRGKRNDSTMLSESVAVLAQWFGRSPEEVSTVTTANARKFFGV
ncbi:MAG: TatD family hydrolase [Oscillospiraceae bacterium]|nr:TatD family hydrolase [Oscillospiraceae bacterium]